MSFRHDSIFKRNTVDLKPVFQYLWQNKVISEQVEQTGNKINKTLRANLNMTLSKCSTHGNKFSCLKAACLTYPVGSVKLWEDLWGSTPRSSESTEPTHQWILRQSSTKPKTGKKRDVTLQIIVRLWCSGCTSMKHVPMSWIKVNELMLEG